ncbi:MAG: hypothetical protein N0E59_21675, partial [Candidatus Thiodiazotropha taylori]|nr:hypothetical protein [Candidatus Thiodiazotropha taylori]MCW4285731.1 hypothetical protein [Candidatus Thiodiazotropha taylori]
TNDTLSSTLTISSLDNTYQDDLDRSVTHIKTVAQTQLERNQPQKPNCSDDNSKSNKKTEPEVLNDCDTSCAPGCTKDKNLTSLRCNICMVWFHTECVGIVDLDVVGAWACAICRTLPKTVNVMKVQLESLAESTAQILSTLCLLSERIDSKFGNINDRLTSLANQNKSSDQCSTDSLSDISKGIKDFRNEVDKKTNTILSKSQTVIDKVQATAKVVDTISKAQLSKPDSKAASHGTHNGRECSNPIEIIDVDTCLDKSPTPANDNRNKQPKTQQVNRDLTFLIGSCLLKNIEPRFLHEKTKIKSFRDAKISNLKDEMTKMNLARYKNIIIHIGGNDIDSNISIPAFRTEYQSLFTSLKRSGSKIFVSGLLPRGGTNVKPFNESLRDLCSENNCVFIDNHDSFMMASGELPFTLFLPDQVNLKFPGIRKLVNSIHNQCPILPKKKQTRSVPQGGPRQMYRGGRRMTLNSN